MRDRHQERAERLLDVTTALANTLIARDVASVVVERGVPALGAAAGVISVISADGTSLEVLAAQGYPESMVAEWKKTPISNIAPLNEAIRRKELIVLATRRERAPFSPQLAERNQLLYEGLAAAPLLVGDRVIGAIGFHYAAPTDLDSEDRRTLTMLAAQCAQALERARLYEVEQEARGTAELLFKLTAAANQCERVDDIFNPALDAIIGILRVDRASILLFDESGMMRFRAWRGLSATYRAAVEGHSPWSKDTVNPQPIMIDDVETNDGVAAYRATFRAEGIGALGFIPLVHGGQLLGKFMVYCDAPRAFTDADRQLAQTISAQVANVVARADLFQKEREARREAELNAHRMRLLENVIARVAGALDVEEVAEGVITEGVAALGAVSGAIWMFDKNASELRLLRSVGFPAGSEGRYARIPLDGEAPVADAVRRAAPVFIESRRAYRERYALSEEKTRVDNADPTISFACLPLVSHGAIEGAIAFSFDDGRWFDTADREILIGLSQHCTQSLDRARLYGAERRARDQLARLQDVTAGLARSATAKEVGDVIVTEGREALGAHAGAVLGVRGDHLTIISSLGYPEDLVRSIETMTLAQSSPMTDVARTGEAVWLCSYEDFAARYPHLAASGARSGSSSAAWVPLKTGSACIGVFGLSFRDAQPIDHDGRRAFILALAEQCAQALERARLYDEERAGRLAAERLTTMLAAAEAIGDSFERDEIVRATTNFLVPRLADWCVIDLSAGAGEQQLFPVLDDDVMRSILPGEAYQEAVGAPSPKSAVSVPLSARGRRLGVLSIVSARRAYDETDLRLMQKVASRAALAIDNALLIQRLQRFQEFASELAQAATPQQVAEATVRAGSQTLGANISWLRVLSSDGAWMEMLAQHGLREEAAAGMRRTPINTAIPARDVLRSGDPLWFESQEAFKEAYPHLAEDPAWQSWSHAIAILPLEVEGRAIGALTFTFSDARAFSDEEKVFVLTLARHAAQALDRARLFEAEQQARLASERAEQALKEADRRKDDFLAVLAHELRNPLAPIRNAVHVLRSRAPVDLEVKRFHEMIDRQLAHMTRMIDDLLDVSRIARGKIVLSKSSVDLVEIVRTTIEDHRGALESAGLEVRAELPTTPIVLNGDRTRLAQVVGNLLQNAAKFCDRGGTVNVRITREADRASIIIQDSGVGMTPDLLSRIFRPFIQEDRTLARTRGGLGLGLAIVKGNVELHGGTVQASSSGPGCGSTFVINLPLQEVALDQHADVIRAVAAAEKKRRVLIVEDNADAAESLAELLALFGHEPRIARNGSEALDLASEMQPEFVLCDIGLPGNLDGFAVAEALRARPETKHAILVAITGYGRESDRKRAHQAGFDLHLTKPVDPARLDKLLAGTN
jgi:two-component system, sensor histidine kinase